MEIRALTEHDVDAWRQLRIRMLGEHPEAFSEALEDFEQREHAEVKRRVLEGNVTGVLEDGELVGCAGWLSDRGRKRRHLATVWGMYVASEARGKGAGRAVLRAVIDRAREAGVERVQIAVAEDNTAARSLYESEGFRVWGKERDALRLPDRTVTELHMDRRLC